MADEGFNPNKSKVKDDTLANFLQSEIKEDLSTVPGIGPATVKALNEDGNNEHINLNN